MIDQAGYSVSFFFFFGITVEKGLTLLIAKLDRSLALIGHHTGVHVAWLIRCRLILFLFLDQEQGGTLKSSV